MLNGSENSTTGGEFKEHKTKEDKMLHISQLLVRFQLRVGINVSLSSNTARHLDHTRRDDAAVSKSATAR